VLSEVSCKSVHIEKIKEFAVRIPHIELNSPTNSDGNNSDTVDFY